jgi:hypothetical protein
VNDLIVRLLTVLDAEHALQDRLCAALRAELAAVSALDVPRLEQLVREKEELVDEARLLEESRLAVSEELARALGLGGARVRLSELCDALGDEAAPLRVAHLRLAARLALARELLEANTAATASELASVQATLRALGVTPAGDGYGRTGATPEAGRLLRQSA